MSTITSALWGGIGGGSAAAGVSARTIVTDVFRDLGITRPGHTASSELYTEALRRLNRMLNAWSAQSTLINHLERTTFDVTANTYSYTWGDDAGGRPVIVAAGLLSDEDDDTTERPINVLGEDPRRTGRGGLYSDNGYPTAQLYLNPAPSDGEQLVLYIRRVLQSFADLDSTYYLPPDYEQAIADNLAVALIPMAQAVVKIPVPYDDLRAAAMRSKSAIASANIRAKEISSDVPGCSGETGYRMFPS